MDLSPYSDRQIVRTGPLNGLVYVDRLNPFHANGIFHKAQTVKPGWSIVYILTYIGYKVEQYYYDGNFWHFGF